VLTLGTLAYLGALPLSWMSYRRYELAASAPSAAADVSVASASDVAMEVPTAPAPPVDEGGERPTRLN
jgi:hypothetical protein